MEDLPSSHTESLLGSPGDHLIQDGTNLSPRLMQLRYHLVCPLPTLGANNIKQKRSLELSRTKVTKMKKIKLEHGALVRSLSSPVQEALSRFREASELELDRLKKEGYDTPSSISKLIDKMKTIESISNDKNGSIKNYSREDLNLVMELSGLNEEGAMRALVLRDELAKLRMDGFNHPEAIDELSMRMKRLVGSKRRPSVPLSPTSAKTLTKRLRKSKSMGAESDSMFPSSLPQEFSFEELERMTSKEASTITIAPFSPRRKRIYEEGTGKDGFIIKRQRLLDALEYGASQLRQEDDNEVTVRDDIDAEYSSSGDEEVVDRGGVPGFMISNPIFSGDCSHEEDDGIDLFVEVDPLVVVRGDIHYSDEERDGDDIVHEEGSDKSVDELDTVEDNTDIHQALDEGEQVWQYNPLRTKKFMRETSNNRSLF